MAATPLAVRGLVGAAPSGVPPRGASGAAPLSPLNAVISPVTVVCNPALAGLTPFQRSMSSRRML